MLFVNYRDALPVRNGIAFAIGSEFGLEETPDCRYVNPVINGKYRGMYMLCERLECDIKSVDLEK